MREAPLLHGFPRYVPCALVLLAGALSIFRDRVGTLVHVAANGGYRSPAHGRSRAASAHCWGTAANIYRVGDELLDRPEVIEALKEHARVVAVRIVPQVQLPGTRCSGRGLTLGHEHNGRPSGVLVWVIVNFTIYTVKIGKCV